MTLNARHRFGGPHANREVISQLPIGVRCQGRIRPVACVSLNGAAQQFCRTA